MIDGAQSILRSELTALLEDVRAQTGLPGLGVAVRTETCRLGAAVGARVADGPDPLTGGSLFHIGCLGKTLISVVVLELAHEGELDLNVGIGEYLPELRGTAYGRSLALVHLLTHTAGYPGTELMESKHRQFTWDAFCEYLAESQPLFAPGTVFSYEHTGAVLAGEIVRRVTGVDAHDLAREQVLEHMGLTPAVLHGDQERVPDHVGQHIWNPRERRFGKVRWSDFYAEDELPFPVFWRAAFSRYMMSLADVALLGDVLNGAVHSSGDDSGGISSATRSQLCRPAVQLPRLVGGPFAELAPTAFTLGAAEYGNGWLGVGAMSMGQCVGLRFHPGQQLSIAVGLNAIAPDLRDVVLEHVCRIVTGVHKPPRPRCPLEFELRELEGTYEGSAQRRCDVELDDERLVCSFGAGDADHGFRAELVVDDDGCAVVQTSVPSLSLGFFREPAAGGNIGLMVGLTAYKRVACPSASAAPCRRTDADGV